MRRMGFTKTECKPVVPEYADEPINRPAKLVFASRNEVAIGKDIDFMVVEKSAVIKFDKHVASRVLSPDERADLDF